MKKLPFLFAFLLCFSSSVFASNVRVTGVITDSEGPVPGIAIIEKGTNNGVITDINGKYTLFCRNDAVLIYKGIGYNTIELYLENVSHYNIDIVMEFGDDLIIVRPSNIAMADASVILIDKMIFDDKIRQSYSPVSA